MDRKTAEQIVALANGVIDQLLASLEPVERAVSPSEFAAYKRGVAKVLNSIDNEVIDLIAREHPDLKTSDDESEAADASAGPTSSHN